MSEPLKISGTMSQAYAMIEVAQAVVYVYEELVPKEGDETGLKFRPNGRIIIDIERWDKPEPANPLRVRLNEEIILELN